MDGDPTPSRTIRASYTNWRGETAIREIKPVKTWFGCTEWHRDEQWFLQARDETGTVKDFALRDFNFRENL